MPDEKNNLYLYEAIELRAEYESRINTLNGLLPEAREDGDSWYRSSSKNSRSKPIKDLNINQLRDEIKTYKYKLRKLNNAIQKANFETYFNFDGKEINLIEALELRKSVNQDIKKLCIQLKKAAYCKIIYKEDRDIIEEPEISFKKVNKELEDKRIEFRKLNRILRKKSFETLIDYKDE